MTGFHSVFLNSVKLCLYTPLPLTVLIKIFKKSYRNQVPKQKKLQATFGYQY